MGQNNTIVTEMDMSVIIPAFNEEENIQRTAGTIHDILAAHLIRHELIFIDDGSKDGTWEQIKRAAEQNGFVKGVRFARNFGKEAAIYAGLEAAKGDCAVVIDCDLQMPPEKIPEMYDLYKEGFEIVEGVKSGRGKESLIYKGSAKIFYAFMTKETGCDMRGSSDFKLLGRRAVDAILSFPERDLFFRAMTFWTGYRTVSVSYDVNERVMGNSKWNICSLTRYAVRNITSFTTAPLQLVTFMGFLCFLFSILITVYSLLQYFTGKAVEGYTTLIIVILFIGSMIMISLGIIGYYLGRIYDEIKHRPKYVCESLVNIG